MLTALLLLLALSSAVHADMVNITWTLPTQAVYPVQVGDVVYFQYDPFHDVYLGPGCSGGNMLCGVNDGFDGKCKLEIKEAGDIPFYCSVIGHCAAGMHSILRASEGTRAPALDTLAPTRAPVSIPSKRPTRAPTSWPTKKTKAPTMPRTRKPTKLPTSRPTKKTRAPTTKRPTPESSAPTSRPTKRGATLKPTKIA